MSSSPVTDEEHIAWLDSEIQGLEHDLDRCQQALRVIRDAHAEPAESGASCAEGCGGRWPCTAWWEAEGALGRQEDAP